LFTDVLDRESSSMLLAYTARFARVHLPLCVTFRNLETEAMAAARPRDSVDCYSQAAALQLLDRRAEAIGRMRQSGVDVLDASPLEVAPRLLNRYLTLKARQRF
jgi:uncharacterized protein (DUF58 family)